MVEERRKLYKASVRHKCGAEGQSQIHWYGADGSIEITAFCLECRVEFTGVTSGTIMVELCKVADSKASALTGTDKEKIFLDYSGPVN